MFNRFFNTKNNSQNKIKLFGEKQQQHTVILDNAQQIESFKLEKIVQSCGIKNLKACDYVLVDHANKKILLCELKNSKDIAVIREAKKQLAHSKHVINLFLNILQSNGYVYALLTLTKRNMNKKTIRTQQIHTTQYTETNKKVFGFNKLNYAK